MTQNKNLPFLHGIITNEYLLCFMDGWKKYPLSPTQLTSIGDYVDLANSYGLRQLWVLPGTGISDAFSTYDDSFVTRSLNQYRVFPPELDSYLEARHVNRPGKEISLVLPAYIKGLPQSVIHMTDAHAMYTYVAYLQSLLGVYFVRDAKGTGIELLYQVNNTKERKGTTPGSGFIRSCESDLSPFYDHKQIDFSWSRPLLSHEIDYQFLHVIDRNVMYLASTNGLHVGSGPYMHVPDYPFSKKQPGLWLVTLSGESPFNGSLLPGMFGNGRELVTTGWLDTAMVQAAIDCGYQVSIQDAYMFPEVHTVFDPWYKTLRDARADLLDTSKLMKHESVRTAVLDTIKMMYKQTVGLMGHKPDATAGEKYHWYSRPDIYNRVISEAKRLMCLSLQQLTAAGIPVVGVNLDDIKFLSNKPFDQALPDTIVLSDQVGKFKHNGSYLLSDVAHLITDKPFTLNQGLARIKKEAA